MKIATLCFSVLLLLGGCAKNLSPDDYSESDAGAAVETYRGTILSVRTIKVKGGDRLEDNKIGLIGGGLAGGILGSQLGKGRGSSVGAIAGVAAGALGGSMLEQKMKTQDGLEYTVQLTNGRILSVVQNMGVPMTAGQKVLVLVNPRGRSRVIPDQTPNRTAAKQQKGAPQNRGRTIVVIED